MGLPGPAREITVEPMRKTAPAPEPAREAPPREAPTPAPKEPVKV